MNIAQEIFKQAFLTYLPYDVKTILSHEGVFNLDCEYSVPSEAYKPAKVINVCFGDKITIETETDCGYQFGYMELTEIRLLLKPMSKLTPKELIDAGFNTYIDYLTVEKQNPLEAPYNMVHYLLSQHYDIFGLIDLDLADEK